MNRFDTGRRQVLLGLAAALFSSISRSEAPAELRIGLQKSSVNLAVLRARGALAAQLPGVRVSWADFPAGPQLLEALNAGSIDFGMTGDTPPVFSQAANSAMVYVGTEPPKPENSAILVKPDGTLKTLADLRGRRIAFQKGSSAHYVVLRALEKAGIGYGEIEPIYLAPADARAAFERGSVDAWSIWDPYWAAAEEGAAVRVLTTGRGLSDNSTFYLASKRWAEGNPAAVAALLAALTEADHYVQSHADEAAQLVATATGVPLSAAVRFLRRRPRSPVIPLDDATIAAQQTLADTFQKAGLIPKPIRIADAVWHASTQTTRR